MKKYEDFEEMYLNYKNGNLSHFRVQVHDLLRYEVWYFVEWMLENRSEDLPDITAYLANNL